MMSINWTIQLLFQHTSPARGPIWSPKGPNVGPTHIQRQGRCLLGLAESCTCSPVVNRDNTLSSSVITKELRLDGESLIGPFGCVTCQQLYWGLWAADTKNPLMTGGEQVWFLLMSMPAELGGTGKVSFHCGQETFTLEYLQGHQWKCCRVSFFP